MSFIGRMFTFAASLVAIGFALWLSFTFFLVLLLVGGVFIGFLLLRQFLLAKGILNPTPGVAQPQPEEVTIIDGEFEQIENPMVKDARERGDHD